MYVHHVINLSRKHNSCIHITVTLETHNLSTNCIFDCTCFNCSIDSQIVNRQSSMWINATHVNGSQDGILIHEHCPFDYCKPERFDLHLAEPDEQCAFHRSSILCGACRQNLSQVFGTSRCRECSSMWVLLWIPAFALAGIPMHDCITPLSSIKNLLLCSLWHCLQLSPSCMVVDKQLTSSMSQLHAVEVHV